MDLRIRLDKLVATEANLTRKEARQAIRRGHVSVNGVVENKPATIVNPSTDSFTLSGEELTFRAQRTLLVHKPVDVVSALRDRDHDTVLDLIPHELRHKDLRIVGRLDIDTTGLLVITTDGDLNHRLTHPRKHVSKTYQADLEAPLSMDREEAASRIAKGIALSDGTICKPAVLKFLDDTTLELVVHEGKYHQIKRMVAALGGNVRALQRSAIGQLAIPSDLRPGECRLIDSTELDLLV